MFTLHFSFHLPLKLRHPVFSRRLHLSSGGFLNIVNKIYVPFKNGIDLCFQVSVLFALEVAFFNISIFYNNLLLGFIFSFLCHTLLCS